MYFNFKSFKDPNSSSFIRFQCILYDSGKFFSHFWDFYKLKIKDLISGGNQFCRMAELFGPSFCICILKVSTTQILCHSLDFNASVWFRRIFLRCFKFAKIKKGDLLSWGETILQNSRLIWSPLLYFKFKRFKDPNSSSFIRFQCILHY